MIDSYFKIIRAGEEYGLKINDSDVSVTKLALIMKIPAGNITPIAQQEYERDYGDDMENDAE